MLVSCTYTGMDATDSAYPSGRVRSGKARMDKLTPEQRHELARAGAKARWDGAKADRPPIETDHVGAFRIGTMQIPCAVLPGEIRVVSERGLVRAFGGKRGGSHWRRIKRDPSLGHLPVILSAHNLRPFIEKDEILVAGLTERFPYRLRRGAKLSVMGSGIKSANGVRAGLIARICKVFLDAKEANALEPSQTDLAKSAKILYDALALTGITSLVDEATRYQYVRDRLALQEILDQYIGRELAKWAKRFPDEFYEQMFRLKGWKYDPTSSKRPIQMAQITLDLVFDRIGPGLTEELQERRTEIRDSTGKSGYLHQVMTPDVGHPALQHHLSGITFLAKAFPNGDYEAFHRAMDRVAPRNNRTLPFPFSDSIPDANGLGRPSSR